MVKSRSGFTIVELLIVIVVIAILAAISIVAYNGIQERARNSQTTSAVSAYIKAINFYEIDEGQHPPVTSCLGVGYECDTGGYTENGGGLNTIHLAPYFDGSVPTPATNLAEYSASREIGGALYAWNSTLYGGAGKGGIGLYHQGNGDCPTIGGLTYRSSTGYSDGSGTFCRYAID